MPKQTFFNLPDDKRNLLIDLALDEFSSNDYENASISRIVAQAGIAKGSFYQYFENKEDLYHYLLDLGGEAKKEFFGANPPDVAQMGVFAYLRWLKQEGIKFELERPRLSKIGYRAARSGELPADLREQAREGELAFFRQLVQQGQADGDINPEIDPDLAAFLFGAVFSELGTYLLNRVQDENRSVEGKSIFESEEAITLFDQVLHILESGMGISKE